MTIDHDKLSKAETVIVAAIEADVPALIEVREIIAGFHQMIRRKTVAELPSWLESAAGSLVASFANGVRKDEAAVRAAITSPWSNGQTEGQITRLKFIKRQMYGRGKIDLSQARMIGAKVIAHVRYAVFQMAAVAVPRDLFRRILDMINDLRPREPAPC